MSVRKFDPLTSKGFVWRNPGQAREMLDGFRAAGSQLLHQVWDWDGTVVHNSGSNWNTMCDALPPVGQEKHKELYRHYKGLQDQGLLTSGLEREWSARALTLHVVNRTTDASLRREAAKIQIRRGAVAAFRVLEEAEVPTVVLSAGVMDVIQMVAHKKRIHPTATVATELAWENERIVGWYPDTVVDSSTKREMGHGQLEALRDLRPHAILFGDQPHDAHMFEGTGLRMRVDGFRAIGTLAWRNFLAESWEAGFDGVTTGEDLLAVAALNRWLVTPEPLAGVELQIPVQPIYAAERLSSQRPV